MFLVDLGNRIRYLRESRTGLSQEKFALKADIDRTYYAKIENGKQNTSVLMLKKIAEALNLTLSELLEDVERTQGRKTFLVFQGDSLFRSECDGGYIWAPVLNSAGRRVHHWDSLLSVREGDIIFHSNNGAIRAISTAKGKSYECEQPADLEAKELWQRQGRKVECDYVELKEPIKTAEHREEILQYCSTKYSPFNQKGMGNQGYLFELDKRLAACFAEAAREMNPEAPLEFLAELLAAAEK